MKLPALIGTYALAILLACGGTDVRAETAAEKQIAFFTQQEATLTRALDETPGSVSLLSRRGDMRQFLGRFKDAIADYEKMIELDPSQDAPHWRLGIAYYFTGAFEKGARQFEKYHAYDNRDRENGVWKFLCQARAQGLDEARKGLLVYTRFDRHPFPSLYEMLEGKKSPQQVLDESKDQASGNPQVAFFAKYYVGVYKELLGERSEGARLVQEAVEMFTPETAGNNGPGYMWQVARLHATQIGEQSKAPSSLPNLSGNAAGIAR
jgi:lipoprotein NlpI